MSNETPGETSPLVVNEDRNTRIPSLRGIKQGFFVAAATGSLCALLPTAIGMIQGRVEVYPSALTAAASAVALSAAAVKFVLDEKNKSHCATNILLIGLQGLATVTTEMASISGLMQTPNFLTGMAAVGGAVMNGAVVAQGALSCVR